MDLMVTTYQIQTNKQIKRKESKHNTKKVIKSQGKKVREGLQNNQKTPLTKWQ